MGKEHQKRTKAVILRSLIMKYNISVKVRASLYIQINILNSFKFIATVSTVIRFTIDSNIKSMNSSFNSSYN
jgi:hypothetical protein